LDQSFKEKRNIRLVPVVNRNRQNWEGPKLLHQRYACTVYV